MELIREKVLKEVIQSRDVFIGLFLAYTRDIWTAEDLYQDLAIRACQRYDQLDPSRPIRPWLIQMAKNLARDRLRAEASQRRYVSFIADEIAEDPAWEKAGLGSSEQARALDSCLQELGKTARELVQAKYVERLSGIKLARRLGIKVDSVYTALARIRRRLIECIKMRLRAAQPSLERKSM